MSVNRLVVDRRRTDRLDDDLELIRATLSNGQCGRVLSKQQQDRLKDLRDRGRPLTDRQYDVALDAGIKVNVRASRREKQPSARSRGRRCARR